MIDGKTLYAVEHVSDGRSRGIVEPGQQLRSDTEPHIVKSLLERGLVTDSATAAKKAADGEREYRAHVEQLQAARSQPRG